MQTGILCLGLGVFAQNSPPSLFSSVCGTKRILRALKKSVTRWKEPVSLAQATRPGIPVMDCHIGWMKMSCLQSDLVRWAWSWTSQIPPPRTNCCPAPGTPVSTQPSTVIPFE